MNGRTTYVDNSVEFLRAFISEIGPTVEVMGDTVMQSIQSQIQRSDEPSSPGEGPASHPPEYELYESWKRGRVRRRNDLVFTTVFSTARSADGKVSLSLVQEVGTEDAEPRPHLGPGILAARQKLRAIAQAGLR